MYNRNARTSYITDRRRHLARSDCFSRANSLANLNFWLNRRLKKKTRTRSRLISNSEWFEQLLLMLVSVKPDCLMWKSFLLSPSWSSLGFLLIAGWGWTTEKEAGVVGKKLRERQSEMISVIQCTIFVNLELGVFYSSSHTCYVR